jgi:hypothetical protein
MVTRRRERDDEQQDTGDTKVTVNINKSKYRGDVPDTDYENFPQIDYAASVKATADAAAVTTSGGADTLVKNDNDTWVNKKWRPMMGWTYMGTCIFDFIIAPILWSAIQAVANGGAVVQQWQPLTLQGAGLYHVAMGAVLGITAFGRTQEKKAGVEGGKG